jgi:hypothetical protein
VEGYAPDEKGRIYTTYNDNPSTLRLGSQDVNTQNVPESIKATIRAPKGWCFVEADSSAIEAVMVGLEAKSPQYVRLAAAGVHDFVLAKALGIEWNPEALKITKSKENKAIRTVKKKTVHLSNYGGTPSVMKKQEPEIYTTEALAAAEQRFYFAVCPDVPAWQQRTRAIVNRTGVLINAWGFHQYFYQVYDGDRPGPDFNRVLGAGPQSLAGLFMRENLFLLKDSKWREFAHPNLTTHDSIGLMVPIEMAEEAEDYLLTLLTRPVPQLDNVRIGAESKVGSDGGTWQDLQERRRIAFEDPLALSTWHLPLSA